MKKAFLFLLIYFLGWTTIAAQEDSLQIPFASLTWEDILSNPQLQINKKVSGASRSLKDIQDLPFSIYVIEGADIRRNGYITLVDALKMLPGIRVSQPGSALEGETFMMRGLLGNAYAKILVNGIPVKPYMVSGMPLGAQLPIQQAERIEVIYGPAAALYGADATTGVINIVMADSERPIFTNASLHVGGQSYTSIHTLFGGKIGKGDKILKFRLFGTNTRQGTRRIFYDKALYNTENYFGLNPNRVRQLVNTPNFRGTPTNPILGEVPHLSRSFGVDLSYRNFQFSYKDFNRQDHRALGLNTVAISYAIPVNTIGESIKEGHLIYKKEFNQFLSTQTTLNFLKYDMDNNSSSSYVSPTLGNIFNVFTLDSLDVLLADSLRGLINDNFFSGIRFAHANSVEYSVEQALNIKVGKAEFNSGFRFQRGTGNPFVDFQQEPIQEAQDTFPNIFHNGTSNDHNYNEFNAFAQLFLPLRKWNILLGAAYLYRNKTTFSERISVVNPRVALLFKAKPNLSFRTSYSTAFKIPGPYFRETSYTITQGNFNTIQTGIKALESERTLSYEIGLRWLPSSKIEFDMAGYYTRTTDFLVYDILPNPEISGRNLTTGYFNDDNSSAKLYGIQSMLLLKNLVPAINMDARLSINISKGKESLFGSNSNNLRVQLEEIDELRAYPNLIAQAQLSFQPFERFTLILNNVIVSSSLTRNILLIEEILNSGLDNGIKNSGYYTLDITGNYQINQNFRIYAHFNNVLNKKYAGIDADSSPDVLLYNPQSLFTFRLGVNYNLN